MASVFLGDLNDFIEPSTACVNPMFAVPAAGAGAGAAEPEPANTGVARIALGDAEMAEPPVFGAIKLTEDKKATVTLDDCLACSGCVTSAETVLIQQQSIDELLAALAPDSPWTAGVVVTVSPQTRAALAVELGLPPLEALARLTSFLGALGVAAVLDSGLSGDLALLEAREEFVTRFRQRQPTPWAAPPVSQAVSAAETVYPLGQGEAEPEVDPHTVLPMLTSACPGWVCYAEKTQPAALPYISTTKSPQQIMGAVVKRAPGGRLFHCAVMPCFDKKLEASRRDFYDAAADAKDVDCVVTTRELLALIQERDPGLARSAPAALDPARVAVSADGAALLGAAAAGGGSGGYLEHVFRHAARELFGVQLPPEQPLHYVQGRNADLQEVTLEKDGQPVLRFARAYGFRNIQGVLMKLKRGRCPYDFVEIMACPSGCNNGGGQLPGADLPAVEAAFHARLLRAPEESPLVAEVRAFLAAQPDPQAASRRMLHTRYHTVPKMEEVNPLGISW